MGIQDFGNLGIQVFQEFQELGSFRFFESWNLKIGKFGNEIKKLGIRKVVILKIWEFKSLGFGNF